MDRPRKRPTRPLGIDQPRPSYALAALQRSLNLKPEGWRSFLSHARNGFADFERATFFDAGTQLALRQVPASWYENSDAIGHIFLRVIQDGDASLSVSVARHLLQVCELGPEGSYSPLPPGIGMAWLHLARAGLKPPIAPFVLAHRALDQPADFFSGTPEDSLVPLCRLILESQGPVEAWDLHAIVIAVHNARLSMLSPFRVFDELMTADWITADLKREFCRGLLECTPEVERLRKDAAGIKVEIEKNSELMFQLPGLWLDMANVGAAQRLPVLKRHAVRALVDDVGEPLPEVIAEFSRIRYPDQAGTAAVGEGVLDLVGLHAEDLGPAAVKRVVGKAIKHRLAAVRHAGYRLGAKQFGPAFARSALRDPARMVRDWAAKLLDAKLPKTGRRSGTRRSTSGAASGEN